MAGEKQPAEIGRDRLGADGDDFYAALMAAHDGLSFEESARLNARLLLLLANQVGDLEMLKTAIEAARKT
ncbi:MAG: DUF2783 domain-containing protein [Rhizobiaceae bacterium]